jgi:hypothetical protein
MRTLTRILIVISMFFSNPLYAGTFSSGDWYWSNDDGSFYWAATTNQADHILGQYCYFEGDACLYLVGMSIDCKVGEEYPALINSDAGAIQVTLICSHEFRKQKILAINSFDDIDRVVRNSTRIGIAVPLENDQFKVGRFSLAGSVKAIDRMRAAATAKMKRKPKNSSRPAEERL